ncbi:hypothetical protein EXIGLDRAFT_693659, partial [Exidia glandulosa HHB12029]
MFARRLLLPTHTLLQYKNIDSSSSVNISQLIYDVNSEIHNLRWDGSEPIAEHIGRIRTLSRMLATYGKPLGSDDLAYILLGSLPRDDPEWKAFRSSVLNSATPVIDMTTGAPKRGPTGAVLTTLDFATVEARVTSEAKTRAKPEESASKATTQKPSGSAPRFKRQHHGRNNTHDSDQCYVLHPELRPKNGAKKGKANKAKPNSSEGESDPDDPGSDDEHYAMAASSAPKFDFPTIADSGCSGHMFYSRSVFDSKTFKVFKTPVKVKFGDDSFVEATGTGDVLLQSSTNSQ